MSSDLRRVLTRAPQMAWQRVDGELVLLAVEGKQLIGLNDVAARVWDLIDDARDADQIARVIADEFDVDAATAHTDVQRFLAELVQRGIVLLSDRA